MIVTKIEVTPNELFVGDLFSRIKGRKPIRIYKILELESEFVLCDNFCRQHLVKKNEVVYEWILPYFKPINTTQDVLPF